MARGYLNRPDLTAERFVPDPFSGVPGARVRITSLRGRDGPGVEFLHYLVPANGRANPADARPEDLWHVETRFLSADLEAILGRLRSAGIEVFPDAAGGVFLRDPDGHALRILPTQPIGRTAGAPATNRVSPAASTSRGSVANEHQLKGRRR